MYRKELLCQSAEARKKRSTVSKVIMKQPRKARNQNDVQSFIGCGVLSPVVTTDRIQ
jgi:hypothetical protein